jgi:hypothetical protein
MKPMLIIYLVLFILLASSCQKPTQAGVTNVNSNCITNPSSCNSSLYQQSSNYSNYGNTANPFNYFNNSAYLCNCPAGMIPTYNSSAGLGCVSSYNSFSMYGEFYAYLYLGWNNGWYQMAGLNTLNSSYSSCYSGAVQSCVVNQSGSCPLGAYCLPNSSGSRLGLCVTSYR